MSLDDLRALEREHVMATYARLPVEFVRGEGTRLYDADGDEYLDFLCGVSVTQLGHAHPALMTALTEQAGRIWHTSNLFYSEPGIRLAQRISERSLGGRVFFCNSGTEATECALKLARRHKPRGDVVVLEGAFHGRTFGALSATPQVEKQRPFEPLVPGFQVVDRDDPVALLDAVDDATAAVLIEPIQGESGIHPVSPEVLSAARDACDTHGALLVFDEIQCGMGRTGFLWAWEGPAVRPDAMTLAKGLGGGVPIGACVARPEFSDLLRPGDHGSTFAGGPLIASVANAVLDVVDDESFLAGVADRGERLADGLRRAGARDLRGRGLMLAFEHEDAPGLVRQALNEERIVLNATGPTTVRLLPPLNVSDEEIDEALERLARLLGA